jgi:hypothetical protein
VKAAVDAAFPFWLRAGGAVVLGLVFLYIFCGNWWPVYVGAVLKKHCPSIIPVIGGVSGAAALFIAPVQGLWRFWPIPLFIDYGCIPVFVYGLYFWKFVYPKDTRSKKGDGRA